MHTQISQHRISAPVTFSWIISPASNKPSGSPVLLPRPSGRVRSAWAAKWSREGTALHFGTLSARFAGLRNKAVDVNHRGLTSFTGSASSASPRAPALTCVPGNTGQSRAQKDRHLALYRHSYAANTPDWAELSYKVTSCVLLPVK